MDWIRYYFACSRVSEETKTVLREEATSKLRDRAQDAQTRMRSLAVELREINTDRMALFRVIAARRVAGSVSGEDAVEAVQLESFAMRARSIETRIKGLSADAMNSTRVADSLEGGNAGIVGILNELRKKNALVHSSASEKDRRKVEEAMQSRADELMNVERGAIEAGEQNALDSIDLDRERFDSEMTIAERKHEASAERHEREQEMEANGFVLNTSSGLSADDERVIARLMREARSESLDTAPAAPRGAPRSGGAAAGAVLRSTARLAALEEDMFE